MATTATEIRFVHDSETKRQVGQRSLKRIRRHSLFLVFLGLGLVLRVLAQLTYTPALFYYDSDNYLDNIPELNPGRFRPLGYTAFIKFFLHFVHDLAILPLLNHIMGLAMATAIYAVLLRRGVRPWLAALAAAPVLVDGHQLVVEQMIMSDVLFQALVVFGIVILLWQKHPGVAAAAGAGMLFAAAALTRLVGQPLVLAGVIFLLLAAASIWRRAATAIVLAVTFAVPLFVYAAYNERVNGTFTLSASSVSRGLYARVATFADCSRFDVPKDEQPLCPRPGEVKPLEGSITEGYTWRRASPINRFKPPPGIEKSEVVRSFSRRVIRHQPMDFASVVLRDFFRPFSEWQRERHAGELPVERWRFQPFYPNVQPEAEELVEHWGGDRPRVNVGLATILRKYQLTMGYTPGPLLLVAMVLGMLGMLGVAGARRSGLRAACFLWVAVGAGLLLAASIYQFTWRYQLPALVLLPPAGALGLTALLYRVPPGEPALHTATADDPDVMTRDAPARTKTTDGADSKRAGSGEMDRWETPDRDGS